MKTPDPVIHHKPTRNRILAACMAAILAIGSPSAMAQLKLTFSAAGDNTTPTGTITINLGTNSASMSNLTGTAGLNAPAVSGALAGLSGSFDVNFEALGTSADNFDASDFTGGAATGIHSGAGTWAVNSDLNTLANNVPGQGIVFTFDFTNLVGATAIDLTAVRWNNDGNGSRLSFRDEGSGTSTALYPGGTTSGTGANQTVTFLQAVDTADQVAFWSGSGGQKRLAEFTFNFVPTGIVPPVGLTASTNGAQVNLDWADDLSGTLDYYSVYRSETSGSFIDPPIATNVLTSDYIDTTVNTGTTYYYVVTATDNVGPTTSGNSNQAQIDVRIQPPTGLTRTQGDGVIDLDWADNTSGILDFYSVYRSETPGSFLDPAIATGLTTSEYSDTSVTNGTKYYYVVTATDNVVAVESVNSAQVSGTPFAPVAGSSLYAHLDGSDAGSVTADGSQIVSLWSDLTSNGNNASSTGGVGQVFFPSLNTSESGLEGVDFGYTPTTNRSTLLWFDPAGQDSWLDFSDGAGALPYSGFAVFAVVHADSILGGSNRDVVMGSIESKFSLRYEDGRPKCLLGGQTVQTTAGAVAAGETVVLAVNYDATTGELKLWDSQSGVTATGNVPVGNFSDGANFLLGGTINSDQYMQGFIGEAKIYRGAMTPAEFEAEQAALNFKWAGLTAPSGLTATEGDGEVILDWADQIADSYTVYRDFVEIATGLTTSSYTDTTVTNGTTYGYYVTATKDSNEGPESATVSATPYAPVAGSSLYAHLDGSDAGSVTADGSDIVSLWSDLITVNGNDASSTGGFGTVFYPSTDLSESGLDGVDFGFTDFVAPATNAKSTLLWFDEAGQDSWLNFNDVFGAKPYSGFAVFAVVHPNAILAGANRDVVMSSTENFFSIRYENGRPQVRLGPGSSPTVLQGTAGAAKVGETLVIAVNYNAATGQLELWDSESGLTATATRAAGDFSSGQGFFLGGSVNPDQFMKGMIGETKIYRGSMTPTEFAAEQAALATKWIGVAPPAGFSSWITGNFANGTVPGGLQGPNQDADNDGISNLVEYAIAGQDPTVSNSTISTFTAGTLSFTKAAGTSGLTYAIQESTDLGISDAWTEVSGGSYVNDGSTISYTLTPGTPAKNFLRLQVLSD